MKTVFYFKKKNSTFFFFFTYMTLTLLISEKQCMNTFLLISGLRDRTTKHVFHFNEEHHFKDSSRDSLIYRLVKLGHKIIPNQSNHFLNIQIKSNQIRKLKLLASLCSDWFWLTEFLFLLLHYQNVTITINYIIP